MSSVYINWVMGLKIGDVVRVVQPWTDARVEGGRVSRGRVSNVFAGTIVVRYRTAPRGPVRSECFNPVSGHSGPYGYLVPVHCDAAYDPEYGMVLRGLGVVNGIRRKKTEDVRVVEVPEHHVLTISGRGVKLWGPLNLTIRKARR